MSSKWRARRLRDCATWISGSTPSTSNADYWGGDIPWISAASLSEFRIHDSDRRISRLGAKSGIRLVPPGTIIFLVRGMSLKSEFRIGIATRELAFGQDCKALLPADDIDPMFLAYAIKGRTSEILNLVDEAGHGTGRLQTEVLEALMIGVPERDEQRRIAGVLSALDNKIELNERLCRGLEGVGALAFEQHVGRALGRGARSEPLSQLFEIGPSRRLAHGAPAPYLEMKNMPTEGHRPSTWTERAAGSGARFVNGDTLLARITPCLENGKAAFVDFLTDGQVGWGSTEYIVLRPRPPIPPEFAYFLVRHDHFRRYAVRHMSGTSGRQRVSAAEVGLYEVAMPVKVELQRLGSGLATVLDAIKMRRAENRTLASVRDALLPRLVSGALRVPEGYEPGELKVAA